MNLRLKSKGPASRQEAWACMTANLALPGSGSLAAGKPVGYFQLGLGVVGFLVIMISGIHFLKWAASGGINPSSPDAMGNISQLFHELLGPLAGFAIAGIALVWAGITSMQILAAHPKDGVPPRIQS